MILIDHIVDGFDQRRHIKRIDIAKGFLKCVDEFILNALHQGKAIAVMGIEGGTVKLRQRTNLFHRNSVYRFFLQQLQKRLLEHHLRIAFPCIHLLHIEPLQKKFTKIINTWADGVAFLSAVWQVLIVSVFPLKYTVLVKDNQHLYAYWEEAF